MLSQPWPLSSDDDEQVRPERATYTRRRLLVAGAITAIPAALWTVRGHSAGQAATPPPTDPNVRPTTVPDESTDPSPTASPTSLPTVKHDLALGMVDNNVAALQQRIIDLAYDPGPVDGYFGQPPAEPYGLSRS